MIEIVKNIIPKKIFYSIKNVRNKIIIRRGFKEDIEHLKDCRRRLDFKKEILEGIITQEYHRIEKGLSTFNFRYGFGQHALYKLCESLLEYKNKGYDTKNLRFRTGISALHAYIDKHKGSNIDVSYIKNILMKLNEDVNERLSGIINLNKSETIKFKESNFKLLVQNRHSIRYFSNQAVDIEDINEAIEIAMKTPSACNRQGWKIRVINRIDIIEEFKKIHNGFSNESQNLRTLILITCMKNYYSYPKERHQGYIDSGLFSMSLIYSLTYMGLATCALNANLTEKNKKKIREILNIDINEDLIMFIAVGHYLELTSSPKSIRDMVSDKTKYYL